jgi:hypothetical protein
MADSIFLNTSQSILNIISESRSRGSIHEDSLIELFHAGEKTEMSKALENWKAIRGDLMKRLHEKDAESVKSYLEDLAQNNQSFIMLGLKRYSEILQGV